MSWLGRLTQGLSKTSSGISTGISDIFTKTKLDDEVLESLEELLIQADMGASVAMEVVEEFSEGRFDKEISEDEVKAALAELIAKRLQPVTEALDINAEAKPHVILVVGVNGNGKTTTVGKMANILQQNDYKVMMAAADTFRAAAVEQLKVWAERVGCPIVTAEPNADPASVAYRACEEAKASGADVLLIDTAGRLHNKSNLMEELKKIIRVIQKVDADAPHSIVQVLDATTGQNALSQVQAFQEIVDVTGLVVTKLDGTAKAGVVVALADKFSLPIHAIGVGEGIEDFQPFTAEDFAKGLVA
ncbi:MAG: signal recognition particle-docking protein FtsY [Rickettsiales bacterium]|nr:signal recognition particle-docking protein FtsY [Rickettsiales bacterium]